MERRAFLKSAAILSASATLSPRLFGAEDEKKGKILYFDLSTEWEHPPTVDEADGTSFAAKIVKKLGESLGFEVDCTKDGSVFDGDLSRYAAFVFYTCGDLDVKVENRIPVSEKGRANFLAAIRDGAGFLGIHSAADTWQCKGELFENQPREERTDYIETLGGDFITHGDMQEATLLLTEPIDLPCLKALNAKETRQFDEWYCVKNLNPDMRVLLVQQTAGMRTDGRNSCYNRPPFPSTWIRKEGKGRVAYMSPGHDVPQWRTDFVQNLCKDLIAFVTGQIDLDTTPNLDKVCPNANVLIER